MVKIVFIKTFISGLLIKINTKDLKENICSNVVRNIHVYNLGFILLNFSSKNWHFISFYIFGAVSLKPNYSWHIDLVLNKVFLRLTWVKNWAVLIREAQHQVYLYKEFSFHSSWRNLQYWNINAAALFFRGYKITDQIKRRLCSLTGTLSLARAKLRTHASLFESN